MPCQITCLEGRFLTGVVVGSRACYRVWLGYVWLGCGKGMIA